MAGLWSTWRPKDASKDAPPLLSCTIITTDSAGPLAEIHDRMPLTISASDWDRWLDPDAPIDEGLLRGHGDLDRIEIREVSRLVNSVRNNGPELIEPAEPQPEQATLLSGPGVAAAGSACSDPQVHAQLRAGHAVVDRQVGDAGLQQHVLAQQRCCRCRRWRAC